MKREISTTLLIAFLLLLIPFQPVLAEHPDEDISFTEPHTGVDFPVGWLDTVQCLEGTVQDDGQDCIALRVIYPAMEDGEGANMAGNGPFTFVQMFGDDGEEETDYMNFDSGLSERGYIVVMHVGVDTATDADQMLTNLEIGYALMLEMNGSNDQVTGSFGQIDLEHWGLGGHGHGAAAAFGVLPYWGERSQLEGAHPPRALFGLGVDFSSWSGDQTGSDFVPPGWSADVAKPSTAFFITGTLDDIAPITDAIPYLNASDQLGWQSMQLLGANHYQYQDSTSFTEGFRDQDASISQAEQIQFSLDHIVPYLDVTVRGDHDSFRTAFNRPDSVNTPSDPNAYIDENLAGSQLLTEVSQTFAPTNTTVFSTQETVNWRVNWTLRDGTPPANISSSWTTEIECNIIGMPSSVGSLTVTSEAECLYPMADVAPGPHVMQMQIRVEGAPMTLQQAFTRTDAPLVFTSPVPFIDVEQRSSVEVEAAVFASDPDGQDVIFIEAELNGGAIGNFSTSISSTGATLTVYHTAPGEYVDGADVRLKIRATGDGVTDEGEVEAMIRVVPVDDPVVVTGTVPSQTLVEDGDSKTIVLGNYVDDPEGEVLIATVLGETQGTSGPVAFTITEGVLTITPLANMNGASILHLLVGDGVNPAVELDVPLYIEPINDPLIVNTSFWNVEVDEDASVALNLSDMAWDLDGDVLFWTIDDGSINVNVVRAASQIIVSGEVDYAGFDTNVYLNVSDGQNTHSAIMNITVVNQPDAPVVTIKELTPVDDRSGGLMWWVYDPDGSVPSEANISVNGSMLPNLSHSCSFDGLTSTNRCLTFLEYPAEANGTVQIRVAVMDGDLGTESASYLTVNLSNAVTDLPPQTNIDLADGALPLTTVGLIGGIVVVLILLAVFVIRRQDSTPMAQLTDEEPAEQTMESSSGGLLARANSKR